MFILSKKVVMMAFVLLFFSICTPAIFAADNPSTPFDLTHQPGAVSIITDEQVHKDWPEVMRMVTRMNEQFDFQEKAQRVVKITGGIIFGGAVIVLIFAALSDK